MSNDKSFYAGCDVSGHGIKRFEGLDDNGVPCRIYERTDKSILAVAGRFCVVYGEVDGKHRVVNTDDWPLTDEEV